jgi:riboflavin kinase/FMN adenylyltransferase
MKIHHSLDSLEGIRNPVVTTGTFDGVHKGHQVIISRLNKLAEDVDGESVLITFHPHPRRVLYPDGKGKDLLLICSQDEKKMLLKETDLDHLVILEFTREFSMISSREFIEDILVKRLNAKVVVVGFNHHFGHNREGDFSYLYQLGRTHGFEVEEIPEQDIQNESVSSTKIRKALLEGNIQRANAYLDHYYVVRGKSMLHQGSTSFFDHRVYDFEITEDIKLLPPDGVYAVSIEENGKIQKGLLSVNNWKIVNNLMNPGVEVEFCYLDSHQEKQPDFVTVYFHKKIRSGSINGDPEYKRNLFRKNLNEIKELIY